MYICITGATYIHTKNKAGDDRLQHHRSGEQVSSTFMATAPTLDVVSPPLQPHSTQTLPCWPAEGRERGQGRGKGTCHGYWDKVGQWQHEEWVPYAQVPIIMPSRTSNPGCRKNSVCSISLLASLSFWFLLGCSTSYANGVEHSGMSWGARGCCVYSWGMG